MMGQRQQPIVTSDEDRVIPFRPRTLANPSLAKPASTKPVPIKPAPTKPAAEGLAVQQLATYRTSAPRQDNRPARPGTRLSQLARLNGAAGPDELDYRHRMIMNLAALVFTLLLTGLAVWLADTISDMRRTQDCVLVGRSDCAKTPLPSVVLIQPADHI